MALPTGVERGRRWGAAVDVCADELGTHGCVLPDGGALASRRARVAGCQVPKRKMRRRARGPFGVRSGPETSPEESWGVLVPARRVLTTSQPGEEDLVTACQLRG